MGDNVIGKRTSECYRAKALKHRSDKRIDRDNLEAVQISLPILEPQLAAYETPQRTGTTVNGCSVECLQAAYETPQAAYETPQAAYETPQKNRYKRGVPNVSSTSDAAGEMAATIRVRLLPLGASVSR